MEENKIKIGSITVNWGSMFSGKTEELLREIRRSRIAGKNVILFKPVLDNRYEEEEVVTHHGDRYKCKVVSGFDEIKSLDLTNIDVVGLDEGQFFGDDLLEICKYLKYEGKKVIVSGLDMWSSGEPVVNMALLAAIANKVTKFNAVCVKTGSNAYISYSLGEKDGDIKVGGSESYIAVSEEVYLDLLKRREDN